MLFVVFNTLHKCPMEDPDEYFIIVMKLSNYRDLGAVLRD